MVTGSSVASLIFNGGVILAADVLGSLAKYGKWPRIHIESYWYFDEDWSDADFMKEAIDAKVYVERICQVKKMEVKWHYWHRMLGVEDFGIIDEQHWIHC